MRTFGRLHSAYLDSLFYLSLGLFSYFLIRLFDLSDSILVYLLSFFMAGLNKLYEVDCFLDGENCRIREATDPADLVSYLNSAVQEIDKMFSISSTRIICGRDGIVSRRHEQKLEEYGSFTFEKNPSRFQFCYLCSEGEISLFSPASDVRFRHHERQLDLADSILITHLLGRAVEGELSKNVLIISSDHDFTLAYNYLVDGGHNVLLAKEAPPKLASQRNLSDPICSYPRNTGIWDWPTLEDGTCFRPIWKAHRSYQERLKKFV